jgi:uncharacterized protein YndB with AHSA1/START domain
VSASENTVRRELLLPHARAEVWQALTTREALAEWMYPNDFEPRVGHRFTFHVPPKPEVKFEGLTVECEVLVCNEPELLEFSWSAGAPVIDTRVRFRLESDGADGSHTKLSFEHAGFDLDHPFGKHALKGAEYGWKAMLDKLAQVLTKA